MGKKPASMVIGIVLVLSLLCVKEAPAMDFPDPLSLYGDSSNSYIPVTSTHGDFYSYSLPVLDNLYTNTTYNSSTNELLTGGPFDLASSPGQISDYIWIYGGSNGHLSNSSDYMDDAYDSNTGTGSIFGTPTAVWPNGSGDYAGELHDPGPAPVYNTSTNAWDFTPQFTGDSLYTWDIEVPELNTFLGDSDLILFFANNQQGGAPNLYAWGRVTLVDLDNQNNNKVFDFNSSGIGIDAFSSNGSAPSAPDSDPNVALDPDTDYVLSGSDVTIPDYSTPPQKGQKNPFTDTVTLPHNIGADEAAYAVYSPELSMWLASGQFEVFQGDFRMTGLNNGDEKLFIMRGHTAPHPEYPVVPEPATMLLLGLGVSGLLFNGVRPRHLTKR